MDVPSLSTQLNPLVILPELIVLTALVVVVVCDLIVGRTASRWTPYVAVSGLLVSVVQLGFQWNNDHAIAFLGGFNGDALSIVFRGIIALSAAVTILISIRYIEQSGTALSEFISILLAATLGGMFLSGADELVTIFIALETLSISSYLLTDDEKEKLVEAFYGTDIQRLEAVEAKLKEKES